MRAGCRVDPTVRPELVVPDTDTPLDMLGLLVDPIVAVVFGDKKHSWFC